MQQVKKGDLVRITAKDNTFYGEIGTVTGITKLKDGNYCAVRLRNGAHPIIKTSYILDTNLEVIR